MDRIQAKKIINNEKLMGYNFFENRVNRENEVVIEEDNGKWTVYVTSERAGKITNSVDEYNTESDALEDFIERLRADKILRDLER